MVSFKIVNMVHIASDGCCPMFTFFFKEWVFRVSVLVYIALYRSCGSLPPRYLTYKCNAEVFSNRLVSEAGYLFAHRPSLFKAELCGKCWTFRSREGGFIDKYLFIIRSATTSVSSLAGRASRFMEGRG